MPAAAILEFITELRVQAAAPPEVSDVPPGRRRVIEILGGSFDWRLTKGAD